MAAAPSFAQQDDHELKHRVLAQAQSIPADNYAFTRTISSEARWNTKIFKKVSVEKFDPTQPVDARWTLVSVDGAPPTAAALRKYRKQAAKRRVVPGYHRVANYFGAPATGSSEADGKTLFRFDSLPKGSVSILEKDFSRIASAEASVSEADGAPFVEQLRVTIKPRRAQLLFKLEGYETTFHYRVGPGGKPFLTASTSDMSGSGLGLKGTMHTATTYSDYQAVGAAQ
jgi:hypothetical protein